MVRSRTARLRAVREHPTPLQLACALDTTLVQTPALALVARRVADAVRTSRSRVVISVGPQMGKTTVTSVFGSLWALLDDLDRRIVVASYALELARTNTRRGAQPDRAVRHRSGRRGDRAGAARPVGTAVGP